ncbi:hypothetical protein [Marinihelvus fidelis]|uniref:hypothetical protein n=1 Tax=Marinihelvus fidelis TaxID=2613842 RepID=UPI001783EE0E|nr:hypothetical protein [Marinihelvus fidelis]
MYVNRVTEFEESIAVILAQLAHHIHPKVVATIQERNEEQREFFESLFGDRVPTKDYLFPGSACVFPGVKRYVSGVGNRRKYNPEFKAIIDDNVFPRHIWCFLTGDKIYSGPSWKDLGLSEFELAHVFSHKESELGTERQFFREFDAKMLPSGDFSCACNVVLLPKGTIRPTDNSMVLKAVFYKRYIDLYGESPLQGRSDFRHDLVPSWYEQLSWNDPYLPVDWESKVERLLDYRTRRITRLMNQDGSR